MKTKQTKYILLLGFLFFLIACSTKKNTFLSRNSHALSTKYNILYNGGLALDKGLVDLKTQYQDNFWEQLPVERMQISEEKILPGETKNADFERAETKAIKAIQKHSMNIQGSEKNPQMDEAHLLLGKSRYYEQRFVPALEAFNYVLYKYPSSDKIYEVKIWREKTNMRLENDALAVNNLRKLLKEIKFKDQIFADANATLAQAFLNLEEKDSAVAKLKIAKEFTKSNEEVSRYHFILGQLYDEMGLKDSANASYQAVIDMNRKAARQYVIHAHEKQAKYFDYEKGDTIAFLKKYNDLLEDRENRPYLDVLNHQMALFYDKKKNFVQAKKYYNVSLKKKSADAYLIASNYRNLADIYFNSAKYVTAGKYFDSTLVNLKPRTREFLAIKKKRENLEDVIKYEGIAQRNDSILSIVNMSENDRTAFFQKHIDNLKLEDEKLKKELEKQEIVRENEERNQNAPTATDGSDSPKKSSISLKNSVEKGNQKESKFYFYNTATLEYGKIEFAKIWGRRSLQDNWRTVSTVSNSKEDDKTVAEKEDNKTTKSATEEERYDTKFYTSQLPTSQTVIDSLGKERNFAYYQLGTIYKEKFKEYQLAANKLEKLLTNNPEERLVLPSMYNLYKIYEIIDKEKAAAMKAKIIAQYPESRYAQILLNPSIEVEAASDSPNVVYENLYDQYQNGEFKTVLTQVNLAIDRFTGDEIVPKFELLKANLIGKLTGLEEYKKALNFVALNYPNVEEGKKAENLLAVSIPKLEALQLGKYPSTNWKILYSTKDFEDKNTKTLREKIAKFIKERTLDKMFVSLDVYTMTDNFVVIHGMKSEEYAKGIASILKEFKEYKVQDTPIIMCAENYTVVQIKKNLQDYLAGKLVENPQQPNWDGTIEKTVVQQEEKPQPQQEDQTRKKSDIKNLKNDLLQEKQKGSNKEKQQKEEENFGLPPTPGMQGSGKKG
ncbi:MAG TPA: gliding motility protein [Flavobacterium sp.]|nr:gliding motility protein [Flavobacterium sp.]